MPFDFRGREFLGAPFQALLARHAIIHYYANPPHKAAIALFHSLFFHTIPT